MRHMHHHAIECLSEGNGNGILWCRFAGWLLFLSQLFSNS
jgi:hypothetical protein